MTHIEIYPQQGIRRRWRYRIVGGNGERMTASQSYRDKTDAKRGALDLLVAAVEAYFRDGGVDVREVSR